MLYQSKLTLRPDVASNQYRNDIAQHILAGKPGGETTGSRKTKPTRLQRQGTYRRDDLDEKPCDQPTNGRPQREKSIRSQVWISVTAPTVPRVLAPRRFGSITMQGRCCESYRPPVG